MVDFYDISLEHQIRVKKKSWFIFPSWFKEKFFFYVGDLFCASNKLMDTEQV
jgi:hypothetical protein